MKLAHPSIASLVAAVTLLPISDLAAQHTPGTVRSAQKVASGVGELISPIDDEEEFGLAVSAIGDIDGDMITDVAVGAPRDDDGGPDRGAIYLLRLNADGTVKAETKIGSGLGGFAGTLDDEDRFGEAVAHLGDVDGDGVDDLAVGAPFDDDGGLVTNSNLGAVWILFMNANGAVKGYAKISDTTGGLTEDLKTSDHFGSALAGLGDLDGDGVPDLAVGSPDATDGAYLGGLVMVLFLNADGTVKAEQKISQNAGNFGVTLGTFDGFGGSLATVPDVDGDGVVELAAGAPNDDDGGSNKGAVYLLFLNATGTVKAHHKFSENSGGLVGPFINNQAFGASVCAVGDIDQDGDEDLVVGATFGGTSEGALWVLFLTPAGLIEHQQEISVDVGDLPVDLNLSDRFGRAVTSLGDTDGDGIDDLVVGAPYDDDGGFDRGAIYKLSLNGMWVDAGGAVDGLSGTPVLTGSGELTSGTTVTLQLSNARPNAPLTFFIGLSELGVSYAGGTFIPQPDILLSGFMTNGTGEFLISSPWPAGVPSDVTLYFQHWIVDGSGTLGVAASNGLTGTTP